MIISISSYESEETAICNHLSQTKANIPTQSAQNQGRNSSTEHAVAKNKEEWTTRPTKLFCFTVPKKQHFKFMYKILNFLTLYLFEFNLTKIIFFFAFFLQDSHLLLHLNRNTNATLSWLSNKNQRCLLKKLENGLIRKPTLNYF